MCVLTWVEALLISTTTAFSHWKIRPCLEKNPFRHLQWQKSQSKINKPGTEQEQVNPLPPFLNAPETNVHVLTGWAANPTKPVNLLKLIIVFCVRVRFSFIFRSKSWSPFPKSDSKRLESVKEVLRERSVYCVLRPPLAHKWNKRFCAFRSDIVVRGKRFYLSGPKTKELKKFSKGAELYH
jgi:hypothetical protein